MALAVVQTIAKTKASNAASVALTFASAPTVGNAVVVVATGWRSSGAAFGTATDNRGHTYTTVITRVLSTSLCGIFYLPIIATSAAPFTITVPAPTGSTYFVASAIEVSGVGTGMNLQQSAGATGATNTPATGATATVTVNDVIAVAVHAISVSEATITVQSVSPAFVEIFEELPFTHIAGEADYRLLPTAAGTTQSCSWTDTASNQWAAAIAVFGGSGSTAGAVERVDAFVWGPI